MAEKPILFSAPMVRAILNGTKTQTRRVVKPDPKIVHALYPDGSILSARIFRRGDQRIHCPHGKPGDLLWVKETFAAPMTSETRPSMWADDEHVIYKADAKALGQPRWTPSIFMQRRFSRLTLKIKSVRVERLQDISEEDAIAEGIERGKDFFECPMWKDYELSTALEPVWCADAPIESYKTLLESINGKGSWEVNPWVWVVEFERVEGEVKHG